MDTVSVDSMPINKLSCLLKQAQHTVDTWKENTQSQTITLLSTALSKVTIGRNKVELVYMRSGLLSLLGVDDVTGLGEPDEVLVERHVTFQLCGIESKIIVQGAPTGSAHPRTVQAIQNALLSALVWNEALITGKAISMKELEQPHGVSQRYVCELIKLSWLSPDIIKSISQGDSPYSLSLAKLKIGFPLKWDQQHQALGYSTR